jgi:hypothetical protein
MKPKQEEKTKQATWGPTQGNWQHMNRKQRREMTRKIQSEDLSLEVVHPDAAGIDIGNESHYVAVPPTRDSEPVRRFGCTTAELKEMAAWLKAMRDSDHSHAIDGRVLDRGLRHTRRSWFRSVPGECPGDEESAGAQKRRAGESMADEAAHLRAITKLVSTVAGGPNDANVLAAAQ